MKRARWKFAGLALLACVPGAAPARAPAAVDWRALIRPYDRTRLRDWRSTWMAALANARANGAGARIAAEGPLLLPDVALAPPDLPDGDYRCRLLRVGAQKPANPSFAEEPVARCREQGGRFAMLDGAQRPQGRIWPLDPLRMVFLGSMALGDESRALDYGRDPDRNAAGYVERIGPNRWRMALPRPQWQSMLDVIEIVPASSPPSR